MGQLKRKQMNRYLCPNKSDTDLNAAETSNRWGFWLQTLDDLLE